MIYRFRVILDAEEDIFRDIEIEDEATLEDFHNVITQSFGFEGGEMAAFYQSNNQWDQGEEIPLFDMGEGDSRTMAEFRLESVFDKENTKMIYIYDFFNMWTFLVELADIGEIMEGMIYPNLMYSHGHLPEEAPERKFASEESFQDEDFDNDPLSGNFELLDNDDLYNNLDDWN